MPRNVVNEEAEKIREEHDLDVVVTLAGIGGVMHVAYAGATTEHDSIACALAHDIGSLYGWPKAIIDDQSAKVAALKRRIAELVGEVNRLRLEAGLSPISEEPSVS